MLLRALDICWAWNLLKNIKQTPKTYIYLRTEERSLYIWNLFCKPTVISKINLFVRLVPILNICLLVNREINSSRLIPIVDIHVLSICHSCVKPFEKFISQSLGTFANQHILPRTFRRKKSNKCDPTKAAQISLCTKENLSCNLGLFVFWFCYFNYKATVDRSMGDFPLRRPQECIFVSFACTIWAEIEFILRSHLPCIDVHFANIQSYFAVSPSNVAHVHNLTQLCSLFDCVNS